MNETTPRFHTATASFEQGSWFVTVVTPSGPMQRYQCGSERQALALVHVFAVPPRPAPARTGAVHEKPGLLRSLFLRRTQPG